MQNPFYIKPGGDYTKGLSGLTDIVGKVGERKREEELKQTEIDKTDAIRTEISVALASNDATKIRAVMSKYPEQAKNIKAIIETKFPGDSGSKLKDAYFKAAVDFTQAPQLLEEITTQFEADGVIDAQERQKLDNFKTLMDTDPEKAKKQIESEFAILTMDDKETWDRYQDITKETEIKAPTTATGKYIQDNPNATSEELIKFEGDLAVAKRKGAEGKKDYAPTQLTKLFNKLDEFPEGHPRRKYYQDAIDNLTSGGNPELERLLAERIIDGKLDFNKLSRRGKQKGRVAAWIAKLDPDFSLIDAEANIKYKTDAANLRTIALIEGIQPLFDELTGQAKGLHNSVIPIFNKGYNFIKLQTGEEKIVAFNNLRDDVIAETERVLMGSGVLSDSKYLRALGNLNSAQSPKQMATAIQQMMLVVQKREEALKREPYPQSKKEFAGTTIETQQDFDLLDPGVEYTWKGKKYIKGQ